MSLIADALKAAQGDRAAGQGGGGHSARRAMAASVLHRGDGAGRGFAATSNRMPKSLGLATTVFGCAVLIAGGVIAVSPHDVAEPVDAKPLVSRTANRSVVTIPVTTPRITSTAGPASEFGVVAAAAQLEMALEPGAEVVDGSGPPPISRPADRRERLDPDLLAETSIAPPIARRPPGAIPATEPKKGAGTGPQERPVAAEPGRFQLTVEPARAASRDLVSEAVGAHRRNDFATAIQLYQQALQQNPRNTQALVNLGASYQAAGQHGSARDAFRRALDINPRDARAWSNLGAALGALGEVAEAQAALGEAIRLDPSNHGARVNLANHFLAKGITADARRLFEEVIRDQPAHAEAQYGLGRALEALGDRPGAAAQYRKFLDSAGGRFPLLETAVRQRIEQLSAAPRR